jgi:HK97 gp10 family phage protein
MGRYVIDASASALGSHESIDRQVHELADVILAEAQERAPVLTGAMRASGFVDGNSSEYTIGFTKDYSAYVEAGTDDTKAQPFLTPAALRNRGEL